MAKGKRTEKADEAVEINAEENLESAQEQGASGVAGMMSRETQMHIFRAMTELAQAFEGMMPKSMFPEEAKKHGKAAKKELLLMMRALIDAEIERVEKGRPGGEVKLKKIKVE
ncbi:MAG: hypothetical protein QW520_02065 [Methanomassiliicoccales archaeon]